MGAVSSELTTTDCLSAERAMRAGKIGSYNCVSVASQTGRATRGDSVSEQRASDRDVTKAMTSAAKAVPDACTITSGKTIRWTATSRTTGCAHFRNTITVTHHPDETIKGEATIHMVMTMAAVSKQARVHSTAYFWVWSSWGQGMPDNVTADLVAQCEKTCAAGFADWGHASESGAWHGQSDIDVHLKKKQVPKTSGFWQVVMSRAGWSNVVVWNTELGSARCDDNSGAKVKPGCVIPAYRPTWAMPTRAYPEFTDHVDNALNSGLPGRKSSKLYLKRLTDASDVKKNGRYACPDKLERPEGDSCDEYSFRSTAQGAYTGNKAKDRKARSFPGCQMDDPKRTGKKGYSRCFIIDGQNKGAGAVLGSWYSSQRVLNEDKFWVGFSG